MTLQTLFYKGQRTWWLSLLFLFCSLTSYATDNPRLIGYPEGKLMGFLGLDTRSSSPTLQDGHAVDLQNVKISLGLDLKKRYGYSVINSVSLDDLDYSIDTINGIFDTDYSNGNSWTLVFNGRRLKYDNSGTWKTVTGTGTITTGQNNQFVCEMALDNAICTNSEDIPLKVNSTPAHSAVSFTGLSSSLTKAKTIKWFQNYLIFGNTTEGGTPYPTRFRWSNVGTIGTWTDADYVDISSLSGDSITAFKEMYGDLYIIMRKSIWKATLVGGNDIFVFAKLIDGIGSIAKNSVQVVSLPGDRLGIIFLSEDKKIYLFNGVTVTDIGNIIQPTLNGMSPSRLDYAVSAFDGKSYFLAITSSGGSTNDNLFEYQTELNEWSKHTQIDANAMARVKENTAVIKTYFGNYKSFVYWMDNPDNDNDVDGAQGIVDSVGTLSTNTETGVQVILDTELTAGIYTGATIRITSGTGSGQETVVLSGMTTGVMVASAFSTNPDSTSIYSIGDINAHYSTKWYDFGDASRLKTFRGMYMWAEEQSASSIDVSYLEDFSGVLGSETKDLSPSSSSLWDVALWDQATWGTTGDKFYTFKFAGTGRFLQVKFSQDDIDTPFHIYGYHLLADRLDRE